MESTGQAQNTPVVDPPQSSAVHDNVEQPMEEVDGAEVNDTTLNANRRACFFRLLNVKVLCSHRWNVHVLEVHKLEVVEWDEAKATTAKNNTARMKSIIC
ncbi:hypothetical protein DdX_20542 [Ditylenchus destructor]|uniref:Uncharacterized protein n=1 Tax=Ditylenchus destructor TaxID=166010 RepID=A0AAD4QTJ9_9BILA|nr:hypothetical protein DdX_20542 [Ditylenchus destructor]